MDINEQFLHSSIKPNIAIRL